jgi:hypothetical protein
VLALLPAATLAITATPAHAATPPVLYVDASGVCSDRGSGTQQVPFCSLQPAADAVQPGQTVSVGYSNLVQANVTLTHSGTPTAPITFVGFPKADLTPSDSVALVTDTLTFSHVHDVRFTNVQFQSTSHSLASPTRRR